jgi:spore maturation protein CgeB
MEIAVISNNDFGIESALQKFGHSTKRYFCSRVKHIHEDVNRGYSPDAVFLMDNGKIPAFDWKKEKFNNAALVLFTRESSEIKDRDVRHALSSDITLTQNLHWVNFLAIKKANVFRFPYWVDQNIYFPAGEEKETKYIDSISKKGLNGDEFIPSVAYTHTNEANDRKYDCICSIEKEQDFRKVEDILSKHDINIINTANFTSGFLSDSKILLNFISHKTIPKIFFEAAACKTLILSVPLDEDSKIEGVFEEEREILYFSNPKDCIRRCILYSKSKESRDFVTEKAHLLISRYHDVEKRIKKLIKEIKITKK